MNGYRNEWNDPPPPIEQGWQCPVCKRVMAPNVPFCLWCVGEALKETIDIDDLDYVKSGWEC